MHEIKIAHDLTSIVLEVASREKLLKVTGVNISFGKMIQIVPEIFEFAFRECVRDTIAADSSLNVEVLPLEARCLDCGEINTPEESDFTCSRCGGTSVELTQGREMFVKSIEGE